MGSEPLSGSISAQQYTLDDLNRQFPARALSSEECAALGVPPGSELGPPQLAPHDSGPMVYGQPSPAAYHSMPDASLADLQRRFPARALTPEECRALGVAVGSVLGPAQPMPPSPVGIAPAPAFAAAQSGVVSHGGHSGLNGTGLLGGEPGRPLTDGEAMALGVAPGSVWGSGSVMVTTVTQVRVKPDCASDQARLRQFAGQIKSGRAGTAARASVVHVPFMFHFGGAAHHRLTRT
jgi:hypothetical protein